jgi:hypothetical protein
MMEYKPDRWVVIKIVNEGQIYHKLLAGWDGGYLTGDEWRMNSGIISLAEYENYWGFVGHSGSLYICHKMRYGLTSLSGSIYKQLKDRYPDQVELLQEDTDWKNINWELSDEKS